MSVSGCTNKIKETRENNLLERAQDKMIRAEVKTAGKVNEAFKRFAKYGSEEFLKFNGGKSALPLVVKYENCTAVGIWHIQQLEDEENKKLVRNSLYKIVSDYISETTKDKRLIMVEGLYGKNVLQDGKINIPFGDFDEAIKKGENIATLFLAKENGINAMSPELQVKESVRKLLLKGFTKDEILLFFIARQIPYIDKDRLTEGLNRTVSYMISEFGPVKSPKPTNSEVSGIIKDLNALFEKTYNKPMFKEDHGVLYPNITMREVNTFYSPAIVVTKHQDAKLLNLIAYEMDILRNKKIIQELARATDKGLSPFIVYGRSHIAIIKPALDYMYGKPIKVQS
jgi:hypothetical protein